MENNLPKWTLGPKNESFGTIPILILKLFIF